MIHIDLVEIFDSLQFVKMSEPRSGGASGADAVLVSGAEAFGQLNPAPRPVFMPETFTGTGREWSDWADQFEMAAGINGWDDVLKLKFMSLLLSGRARDVYCGLPDEARQNFSQLKAAMGKCFEPCESTDWNRVSFSSRKRQPNETVREFGNALRRLISKAYPSVDGVTRDLLARDHFIAHIGCADTRIHLRSVKPATLEGAINLASELELIRNLERNTALPNAKVCGVVNENVGPARDGQIQALVGMVEGLRHEVKALQSTVKNLQDHVTMNSSSLSPQFDYVINRRDPKNLKSDSSRIDSQNRDRTEACWECGCTRHFKKDCPYVSGNGRGRAR